MKKQRYKKPIMEIKKLATFFYACKKSGGGSPCSSPISAGSCNNVIDSGCPTAAKKVNILKDICS